MTALTMIRVWFSVCEDDEYIVTYDDFPAESPEHALELAREDYPGCDQYSLSRLVA